MLQYIINLIIFIPITIILIVASIKLSKLNSDNIDKHKYIKVLERTNLSKDTSIFILKIGDEGCVVASSPSKIEMIKELSQENITEIEEIKEGFGMNLTDIDIDKFKLFSLGFRNRRSRNNTFSNKKKPKFLNFNKSDRLLFHKK